MKAVSRGLFYGVSALGLALGLWGWTDLGRLSLPPPQFDPGALPYPVRVGDVVIANPAHLRFWVQSEPPGSRVAIVPESRPEATIETRLIPQLTITQRGVALITGLFFLAVNLLVFCPRMREGTTHDFYWTTLFYGVAILIGGAYRPSGAIWPDVLPSLTWIGCLTFLPFFFAHLTFTFPRRWSLLERSPIRFPVYWLLAAGLSLWLILALLGTAREPGPASWQRYASALRIAQFVLVLLVAIGVVALFRRGTGPDLTRERRQKRWLQWGFTVGVAPYVFLRTLPRLAGLESPVDPSFDRLFELAIPIAFTAAIARERFLDIDLVIRRSLLYSILAGLLVAIYFVLVYLLGVALRPRLPGGTAAVSAIAAAVAVLLFPPTRTLLGHWVDRTLFKLQSDQKRELARFQIEVADASSQLEVAERLRAFLGRVLGVRRLLVVLPGRGEPVAAGEQDLLPAAPETAEADPLRLLRDSPPGDPARGLFAAPQSTSLPETECANFPGALRAAGVRLVAPITPERPAGGWALLGDKLSERRYVDEDLELLRGALSASALSLERIELVQRVTEESMERRRLDEVSRLKNDFLSRISHDLRTPLTSIGWSARNLLDGVAGPLAERQKEYLEGIRASADQLSRLVTNLVEISRLEADAVRLNLEPVRLAEALHEAELAVIPIAAARGVRLLTRADDSLGGVRADRSKLVQVAVNLLDNAVKFSPDGSAIELGVFRARSGEQSFSVRDHGPGVRPEEREAIFERYRQGRPAPHAHAPGLGVGLYVVRTLLKLQQGDISVNNHPDGGAVFTCTLPDWEAIEGGSDGQHPDRG